MKGKEIKGKFWWEYDKPGFISLISMRGTYDPCLSADYLTP